MELPPWVARVSVAVALAALVAWSAWNRWLFLDETPFPVGVDGYYYAVQVRSILEHGHLHYAASPVTFWLLAPFAWATDPITGAKLGAAVLGALVALPAYGVGRRLGGSRATGLLAAALATPSAGSFYLSLEFVKNGVGLTVALVYVWLLLRALEKPAAARIAWAAVALVVAFFTHKMAAGLALVVTVPAVAVEAAGRSRKALVVVLSAAAGAVALAGVFLLVFGAHQLRLVGDLFTSTPDVELPALRSRHSLWFGHEAAIAGALAIAVAVLAFLPRKERIPPAALAVALTLAALALVMALPWLEVKNPQGLGFRLRVAAFVPMALLGATAAGMVGAYLPRTDVRVAAIAAFALVWAAAQPRRRPEGTVTTHPALALSVQSLDIPEGKVVICPERHIVFMVAWYRRADVRLRPDGVAPEDRIRLLPLAFTGMGSPLDDALLRARDIPGLEPPRGFHPRHPNGLLLVPEATWEWAIEQVPADRRERLRKWRTI